MASLRLVRGSYAAREEITIVGQPMALRDVLDEIAYPRWVTGLRMHGLDEFGSLGITLHRREGSTPTQEEISWVRQQIKQTVADFGMTCFVYVWLHPPVGKHPTYDSYDSLH